MNNDRISNAFLKTLVFRAATRTFMDRLADDRNILNFTDFARQICVGEFHHIDPAELLRVCLDQLKRSAPEARPVCEIHDLAARRKQKLAPVVKDPASEFSNNLMTGRDFRSEIGLTP